MAQSKETRALQPEHFAPFSEVDLQELAARIQTMPAAKRREEIEAHPIGATLLKAAGGALDEVTKPLVAVFGVELARAA